MSYFLVAGFFLEEPGFLLDLVAVAGNRSQGSTRDCAHSSPLPSLDPSASPSARLPLVTSLLLLLSLPSCHHPASVSLLLLIPAVILSSSAPSVCPPPFFSPYLLHLLVIPFPSPLSLFPPAQTVLRGLSIDTRHRRVPDTRGPDLHKRCSDGCASIIFYHLLVLLSEVPNYLNAK